MCSIIIWHLYRHSFFVGLYQYFFFFLITNWTFVASLQRASLWWSFSNKHLLTSCLCVTFGQFSQYFWLFWMGASLVAQLVKNLPVMQETWVPFLSQEDPLEKEIAAHSVFFPGESHGQRSLAGYSPWGVSRVRPDWPTQPPPSDFSIITVFFLVNYVQWSLMLLSQLAEGSDDG